MRQFGLYTVITPTYNIGCVCNPSASQSETKFDQIHHQHCHWSATPKGSLDVPSAGTILHKLHYTAQHVGYQSENMIGILGILDNAIPSSGLSEFERAGTFFSLSFFLSFSFLFLLLFNSCQMYFSVIQLSISSHVQQPHLLLVEHICKNMSQPQEQN